VSLSIRARLKEALLQALGTVARRHAVLLPRGAGADEVLLSLRAPYRAANDRLVVDLLEPGPGTLSATLLGYKGHFPSEPLWVSEPAPYAGPCELVLDIPPGIVTLAGRIWGRVGASPAGRRLCWRITLAMSGGRRRERMTGQGSGIPAAALGACDRPLASGC